MWVLFVFAVIAGLLVVYSKGVKFGDTRGWERCEQTMEQRVVDEAKRARDAGYWEGRKDGLNAGADQRDAMQRDYGNLLSDNKDLSCAISDLKEKLARKPKAKPPAP
jgi:hypothetical protein